MSRWVSLSVMMTFFTFLPLDLDAPALNLCIMAALRWGVLAAIPDAYFAREQMV